MTSILEILESNQADNLKVVALEEALKKENSLDLSDKNITDADVINLAEALKNNDTVTHLNLSNNQLYKKSAEALALTLSENKTLSHLNIGYTGIGIPGLLAFAKTLETNQTLKELNLSSYFLGYWISVSP